MLTGSDREVPPVDHVQRTGDAFSDLHTTPSAVYDIVSSLNVGKSPGYDDIQPCLLRACAKGISSSLASLFNLSFTQGKVPAEWKKALVVPVFKRRDKSLPTNCRPISLLCIVSKVQERIVYNKLYQCLSPILSSCQSGFRKEDGTEYQLLRLVQQWSEL